MIRARSALRSTCVASTTNEAAITVVESEIRDYSRAMSDKRAALLERLTAHQRDLVLAMAEHDGMPAGSALRQVAELENVIAAVESVADEEARR
ncbi:hypothetical protein [Methylobacterium sp. CM6257]